MAYSASIWQPNDILKLAFSPTRPIDAQRFADRRHWQKLGRDSTHLWGTFQGTREFQVMVDLSTLQINTGNMICPCNSGRICEHVMALLLLWVNEPQAFPTLTTPSFIRDHGAARRALIHPNADMREDIQRGLAQLDHWLIQTIRQGLGKANIQHFKFWDDMADRMLAAWMPHLAQWLRDIGATAVRGGDWVERVLAELGRLYLLVRSFDRYDQLPAEIQGDIRQAIGWRIPLTDPVPVSDDWFVLGQRQRILRHHIPEQVTWIYGTQSQRMAVLHSVGSEEVIQTAPFKVGYLVESVLAFLPSRAPLTAQVIELGSMSAPGPALLPRGASIAESLDGFSVALTANPWLKHYPVFLRDVFLMRFGRGWVLRHADGMSVPVAPTFLHKWVLHGVQGGHAARVAGLWNGQSFHPLSVLSDAGLINLSTVPPYKPRIKTRLPHMGF